MRVVGRFIFSFGRCNVLLVERVDRIFKLHSDRNVGKEVKPKGVLRNKFLFPLLKPIDQPSAHIFALNYRPTDFDNDTPAEIPAPCDAGLP